MSRELPPCDHDECPPTHCKQPGSLDASAGSLDVEHRKAWEKNFITPIAKTMKQRGVAYMVIIIRDDGKAAYVLDTEVPENS